MRAFPRLPQGCQSTTQSEDFPREAALRILVWGCRRGDCEDPHHRSATWLTRAPALSLASQKRHLRWLHHHHTGPPTPSPATRSVYRIRHRRYRLRQPRRGLGALVSPASRPSLTLQTPKKLHWKPSVSRNSRLLLMPLMGAKLRAKVAWTCLCAVEPWDLVLVISGRGGVFAVPRGGRIWIWKRSGRIDRDFLSRAFVGGRVQATASDLHYCRLRDGGYKYFASSAAPTHLRHTAFCYLLSRG